VVFNRKHFSTGSVGGRMCEARCKSHTLIICQKCV